MTSFRRLYGIFCKPKRNGGGNLRLLSDLFDSHIYLPSYNLGQDGWTCITSMRNGTALGPGRTKAEHRRSLPPVIVRTVARLLPRNLSQCEVPTSWKTSNTVLRREA
ncbi:unnamed protein product [Haemonchus placei]|uniref:Uncharacterized protein n=1 Tax=Haemonchus placei TaxID=6290 RepID=A0A0N4W3Z0_HAEPC|nr:unnamed protein product [Haemonchus placei]